MKLLILYGKKPNKTVSTSNFLFKEGQTLSLLPPLFPLLWGEEGEGEEETRLLVKTVH